MIAFKTDENLPREAAELLRGHGYNALTVVDQLLGGHPDPDVSAICKLENRVLITLDLDFANIRVYPPADHPGIIVLRNERQDKRSVLATILQILPMLNVDSLTGQLWIVEASRVRVWQGRLPASE